ncbi:flagellar hook-basal body complex protein FliE [Desulfonatronum thiosulfatophilum]|uniref:Flagellar hook-basal body complex protein FliE n=1 Tax=Desulfonatronum thiosulfatophilum TaxID=617002 RepID=A0A1G6AV40_9BACT|nr:flagellar hook-basal body complex protein FliE [Desulfonatronum thiosulfatophilum]SDB12251.1 flagellar hook-basal body complex protein FliE [Desulfonatronum thiosulfatophilum]
MAISPIALKAYAQAAKMPRPETVQPHTEAKSFTSTLQDSLRNVNNLRQESVGMIESFAAGENQNVHELMIAMQKASLSMNMTSAVRNKLMEAYKEVMRMPF